MSLGLGGPYRFPIGLLLHHDSLSLPNRPALFQWNFPPALIHLDPDRKSCVVKCLCFIVCLVCFIVWDVSTLCGGCHLRIANVEPSRLEVRCGTCASLTSLGIYLIQRVICLRLARIF